MKRISGMMGLFLFALLCRAEEPRVTVSDLSVKGEIEGENIVFTLEFEADVTKRGAEIPLVTGDVAFLDGRFPRKAELLREGEGFALKFAGTGRSTVVFRFASRAGKEREWRRTGFAIPAADIRQVAVVCDRDDLEVRFPGALKTQRGKSAAGKTEVTAFLGLTGRFEVLWKPEVKRLDAELVVAAEANTIATASVGAMRLDSVYTYRIVQGALSKVTLAIPESVNITQVHGEDIQDWSVRDGTLAVTLSRPREGVYKLHVESETALAEFPAAIDLPVMTPQGVIRTSGFLMLGSDSAVKLLVTKSLGLTQVDHAAFPQVAPAGAPGRARALPSRSAFAYQYANMPYTLQLDADDIVPEYSADDRLVLTLKDNDLVFTASAEVDVRDAGTRELVFETDPAWVVANVTGSGVSDYDVRDVGTQRLVHVYFAQAMLGRVLVDLRLEKSLGENAESFAAPHFRLTDARSERGHLVLATEKGLRLRATAQEGIREVRTGSTPMTVEGAQQAFRFKQAGWTLAVAVQRTTSAINAEIFHLVSIGEGVLYGASTITYHIDGAPVRDFSVRIPEAFQNVEFTGRDVRGWERSGDVWTVSLLEKVIGDYTLLATYNQQYTYEGAAIEVGGVSTEGTESELGYIALAGAASLKFPEETFDPAAVIPIDAEEIPAEYKLLINDPVLKAYKHVRVPHIATLKLVRYDAEALLNQIVDHATLQTAISRDGEAVTTINYFIKNTSQQYLVVTLPAGAKLWATHLLGPDGVMTPVAALESEGRLLVPLQRPRDPNAAMKLELVYAQSFGKPGLLGARYALLAPDLPQTHAIATTWSITPPKDMTVAATGGNMLSTYEPGPRGLRAVAGQLAALAGRLFTRGAAAIPALALLLGAACLVAYCAGRRRGLAAGIVVAVVILPVAGALLLLAMDDVGLGVFRRIAGQGALAGGTVVFTKMVALSSGADLTVTLGLVPDWIGAAGSTATLMVAGAAGLLVLIAAGVRRQRMGAALGLTLLCVACAQVGAGRAALAALAGLIVLLFVLRLARRLVAACHRRGVARRAAVPPAGHVRRSMPASDPGASPLDGPFAPAGTGPAAGVADLRLLAVVVVLSAVAAVALAETPAPNAAPAGTPVAAQAAQVRSIGEPMQAPAPTVPSPVPDPMPVAEVLEYTILGPGTGRDTERSAAVSEVRRFSADGPVTFRLLAKPAVLTHYALGSARLTLRSEADGYHLVVDRKGDYAVTLDYLLPVSETNGAWDLRLTPPDNMRNSVTLTLPEAGLDVRCAEAVLFTTETRESNTVTTAVLGTAGEAHLVWLPRVRKTTLEKGLYFCEVNSFAAFEPGVVDIMNVLRFQIAQGELKAFAVTIPAGMSVTAVKAAGLSTWRFDPEEHLLEAALDQPVSGDFTMEVMTQIAMEGLPYQAELGALIVQGAERQRGSIALAAPDTVQVQVGVTEGLSAMNVADFSPEAAAAALQQAPGRTPAGVKRAFRYQAAPFSAAISAARVLPELRVTEKGSLSIADERIVLSTQLGVSVAKAGVFSLRLRVPGDFDVETLTGEDISHWDEVDDPAGNVIVHFNRQVTGTRTLNIVVASMEKGLADGGAARPSAAGVEAAAGSAAPAAGENGATILVPRVTVADALKLEGTLVISGERGVRLTPVDTEREGVSDLNPRADLGLSQPGLLAFRLLRPEWRIVLRADVQSPVVKPEVLQQVNLAEGMLQGRVFIQYEIENAGLKTFHLRAPAPGTVLSVLGRGIAKVTETDKTTGLWQVDLHNKVEDNYGMEVTYQSPFNASDARAEILPLRTVNTEPQKGYLVVLSAGRIQVKPEQESSAGLKPEDSRSIPSTFGAGDLSDAILCYRAVHGDYALALSVVRHDAAAVLPARVDDVALTSIVSDQGQLLTHMAMTLRVGNLRFLNVTLPEKDDRLWTAFVAGKVARPARDGAAFRIPLDVPTPGEPITVEITYASHVGSTGWSWHAQRYEGPRFNLPLNNITWTFRVPPGFRYYGMDGTLELVEQEHPFALKGFVETEYLTSNRKQVEFNRVKAKSDMERSEEYAQQGQQKLAKEVLQEAMELAPNQADYEDARVQYRTLSKQQAVVGLVQRRNKMRWDNNIQDEQQLRQMRGFQEGNYTKQYAEQIAQSLDEKENDALGLVADKFMDQQAAAAGVAEAINVNLPDQGLVLQFQRPMQIQSDAEMYVEFKAAAGRIGKWVGALWPVLLVLVALRLLVGRIAGPRAA